jgi:hypothetical protein
MEWSRSRRAACATAGNVRRLSWTLAAVCATALAGCSTDGQPIASTSAPHGATVAFESIDGPPPAIFHKLVQNLNEEAQAHQLAVVSRESPSVYRVRGYLSAHVMKGHTAIAWVWDVYDSEQHRALRITGTEEGNARQRTWVAADDAMLHKIARTSMEQLAAFLTSPTVAPAAPREPEAAIASLGDRTSTPESAGIFRIFQAKADPVESDATVGQADAEAPPAIDGPVPLPPHRPRTVAAASGAETLTLAASRR